MVRGAVADRHDHHHRRADRHLAVGGARTRTGHAGTAAGLAAHHLANLYRQGSAGADRRQLPVQHRAVDRHLPVPDPVRRIAVAVLCHHAALRAVAGRFRPADLVAVRHSAAGVYRRVRVHDAGDPALRLRLAGGEYAGVVAGSDLGEPDTPLHRHHQADLPEGRQLQHHLAQPVAAAGDHRHHRQRRLRAVPPQDRIKRFITLYRETLL